MNGDHEKTWEYFYSTGIWPDRAAIDPYRWLENFQGDTEKKLALRLLDNFSFFSERLTKQLFLNSFLSLSHVVISDKKDNHKSSLQWKKFVENLIIVKVRGEKPKDVDSAFIFSRMSRDVLKLKEHQICSEEEAFLEILNKKSKNEEINVVFVDDFIGSGSQIFHTWNREYQTGSNQTISYNIIKTIIPEANFFYCPLICTSLGYENISNLNIPITLLPTHLLSDRYSAYHPNSIIWRDDMKTEGIPFLHQINDRAGFKDTNGKETNCRRGFHKLGLALSFFHCCPDATLPIFYEETPTWKPLVIIGSI